MNRAEKRRLDRVVKKVDNPTRYVVTLEQLDQMKHEIATTARNEALKLLFSIPLKIAYEQLGWNPQECEWFAEAMCDEYEKVLDSGEMTIDEYVRLTEKLTGMKFK